MKREEKATYLTALNALGTSVDGRIDTELIEVVILGKRERGGREKNMRAGGKGSRDEEK